MHWRAVLTLRQRLNDEQQVRHHFRGRDVIDALAIGRHARYHLTGGRTSIDAVTVKHSQRKKDDNLVETKQRNF